MVHVLLIAGLAEVVFGIGGAWRAPERLPAAAGEPEADIAPEAPLEALESEA